MSSKEHATFQAMAWMAMLSTALEGAHAMAERRAGRDPAMDEAPDLARVRIRRARTDLAELHFQLNLALRHLSEEEEVERARWVRFFDLLMALRAASRHLHQLHQALMSLYPAVDEQLIEEVRLLHGEADALAGAEEWRLVERLPEVAERLGRLLAILDD